jgi:hypothetical protein
MTIPADDAQQKIETYLGSVRARLRGIDETDVRDIVTELRSHITDKVAASGGATPARVHAALAALGAPEELAGQYITDNLLAKAEITRSPVRILDVLFRWASLSVAGFFVLLASIAGYFLGGSFFLCALLKPLHPGTAGLWLIPDASGDSTISLRLGFSTAPSSGKELLGWWILPLGLVIGCGLVVVTTRFAIWSTRRYRASRPLPGN